MQLNKIKSPTPGFQNSYSIVYLFLAVVLMGCQQCGSKQYHTMQDKQEIILDSVSSDNSGEIGQEGFSETGSGMQDTMTYNSENEITTVTPRPFGLPKASMPPIGSRPQISNKNYALVKVFYATDRNIVDFHAEKEKFGDGRNNSGLVYGTCNISIPRDHQMGEIESPSIWKLEFRENPEKHVVLMQSEIKSRRDYFNELKGKVAGSRGKNAFLFIHGFNVSFTEAAKRTAQMCYDLTFDGAPVFYSWPSKGSAASYTVDATTIQWSYPHIKKFIKEFIKESSAENIYLIAHSMGNQGLTAALESLFNEDSLLCKKITQIILAAPDIDSQIFRERIAPALTKRGNLVSLYASSEDEALIISKTVNGEARAGDSGNDLVLVDGIETIDATGMDTGFLKHSYFAECTSVISDIRELITFGTTAEKRKGLVLKYKDVRKYWKFADVN